MYKKTEKIVLDGYGSYLGVEKGCFLVKAKTGIEQRYPLFESTIGEIKIKSGNTISSGALATCGFWGIDCIFLTTKGRPVAMLKSLDDDSHVKTRLVQYDALKDERGFEIAKTFVRNKIEGQNNVLKKYGLITDTSIKLRINALETTNLKMIRRRLTPIEAKFSRFYFKQIFQLIPENIRPEKRKGFRAYDGMNNIFNLAYEVLAWKVHRALVNAKLEPYLGFLHSEQFGKPSLVCDFQELFRYLIDDFIIQYSFNLRKQDFGFATEKLSTKKYGQREHLINIETKKLTKKLNEYFETTIEIPRIRVGKRQTIETLINEEALLFGKFLRNEVDIWHPRIAKNLGDFVIVS